MDWIKAAAEAACKRFFSELSPGSNADIFKLFVSQEIVRHYAASVSPGAREAIDRWISDDDFPVDYKVLIVAEVQRLVDAEREKQREADAVVADDHDCKTWAECCDCRGKIAAAIRGGDDGR